MSGEIVRTSPERQIRSYHRAFLGELTLYTFGGDLRPWRPIPARGIFWVAAIEVLGLVFAHAVGLNMPFATAGWGLYYLVVPIALAWLFTVARIEGRRLHVALVAWMRYAALGTHLVGGYRRLSPRTLRPIVKPSRIDLAEFYEPPRSRVNPRYAVATLPILVLLVTVWLVVGHRPARAHVLASAVPAVAVAHPVPRLRIVFRVPPPLRLRLHVPRSVPKPARRYSHARAVRRRTARHASTPYGGRVVLPVHRQHVVTYVVQASSVPPVATSASVVHHAATSTPPRPASTPTCYPGQLGC